MSANYTLDKDFCASVYTQDYQIDELYDCYLRMGLDIPKDRLYCEIKFKTRQEKKYECLEAQNIADKGSEYCYYLYGYAF